MFSLRRMRISPGMADPISCFGALRKLNLPLAYRIKQGLSSAPKPWP
ncbi:hypothetical protein ACVJGD_007839 [Bradyrhizobium sp. USDA 10063]